MVVHDRGPAYPAIYPSSFCLSSSDEKEVQHSHEESKAKNAYEESKNSSSLQEILQEVFANDTENELEFLKNRIDSN